MKPLLIYLSFLLLPALAFTQVTLPVNEQGEIEYSEVILAGKAGRQQLLARATHFANEEKNLSDIKKDTSVFTVKHTSEIYGENFTQKLTLSFILRVDIKDNKYKYTINNITYRPLPTTQYPRPLEFSATSLYKDYLQTINTGKSKNKKVKNAESIFKVTDKRIREFIDVMKIKMQEEVNSEDDW